MTSKQLLILLIVTLVTGVAAVAVVKSRSASVAGDESHGLLYPNLLGSLNDVAKIEITTKDGTYRIIKEGDSFGLEEKDGFPVDFERVKKALVSIAELKIIDKKTDKPDKFASLGLDEPGPGESSSKLVTLYDASGTELASVLLGNSRPATGGMSSLYARKAGEDQCWLVEGRVTVDDQGTSWLDKEILKVAKDRVRRVEITHADGEHVVVQKNQPGDKTLEVVDMPEGRELKYASVANGMSSAIEWCNLEDVMPASEMEFPTPESTAVFTTFDGLQIKIETFTREEDDKGEKTYARFSAAFVPAEVFTPPAPADDETEDEAAAPPPADIKPADEVKAEAGTINAHVASWIYVIPQYNKTTYTKRMEDLLKPLPEEGPPVPADEPAATQPATDQGGSGDGQAAKEDGASAEQTTGGGGEDEKKPDTPPAKEDG